MKQQLGLLILLAGSTPSLCAPAEPISLWSVDPHQKIFRDALPAEKALAITMRAARNEFESGQCAFRSSRALKDTRVEVSPLHQVDGQGIIGGENITWNFVGYIPLEKNTRDSDAVRIRPAPCEIPDPLLDAGTLAVPAGSTQPVWLTVHVPADAAPGLYRGELALLADSTRVTLPVELTIAPFSLPEQRHVYVVNWFSSENIAKAHQLQLWSEPFWDMLARYARNMAEHRQNVVLVPWSLIQVTRESNGKLAFDYHRFDRFVELFERAGVADRITISHAGHGKNGWGTEVELAKVKARDVATGQSVALEPEHGLLPLLRDLERHLDERGWLSKALIHVSDEPSLGTLPSWRKAAERVHQAAPKLRRIEAIETIDCSGDLEVWVPQLIHFDRWRDAYEAHRSAGEFWFYICCNPYGNRYPNRFLDYPLSQVRVLHWLNYSEQLAGYLHWGLNFWGKDPFGVPSGNLPPGDTHIIYPGKSGPLNSIRWEIERNSLEDYEYLWLLTDRTEQIKRRLGPAADWVRPRRRAEELSRKVVPAIARPEKDPATIMAVRQEISDELVVLDQEPLLLMETEPRDGTPLIEGPVAVEVRGITQPGTTIKVNGRPATVDASGNFTARTAAEIRVEAERNGKKKTLSRHFAVVH